MSLFIEISKAGVTKATDVAITHNVTVLTKSTNLSGFNQNQRTTSQYPEAPHAEAPVTTNKNLAESPGVESPIALRKGSSRKTRGTTNGRTGITANPRKGVVILRSAATATKAVPCARVARRRSDRTIDVA